MTIRVVAAAALAILVCSPVWAQDTPEPDPKPEESEPEEPEPEVEKPPVNDEVHLVTGELLQGEIVTMSGGKLKMKSLQLAELEIPWEDVARIRTAKPHTFKLADGTQVKGPVTKANGEWQVGDVTFARADIAEINPAPPKTELDYWTVNVTAGMTLTYGNTRTRTFAGLIEIQREDDNTRFALAGSSTYGLADSDENAKSHRLDGQFDYKITDSFYVIPVVGHVFYDKFQNIKLRYRVGSGVGYYLFNDENWLIWNVEAGFGYGVTELRREPPGVHKQYDTSLRAATNIHMIVSEWLTADAFYETYLGTKDIQNTLHRATFNLAFAVWEKVSLNVAGIYDRVERPIRGRDGKIPKKDDFKLIMGIGVSF